MKNRCIIAKTSDNIIQFICLSENDSVVATKTTHGIMLQLLRDNSPLLLKVKNEVKDQLYDRLCYFLKYGEALVIKNRDEICTTTTFDVEQQIEDIKKRI